jgi:hypothetical protein
MKKVYPWNTIREAILVFLMVLIAYGYFSTERDVNINSRLALVKAFVDEGRFEIDSYHRSELYTVDKSYFNGHYYSDKAVGTATLGIIAYYPVRYIYYMEGIKLTPRLFREWLTFLAISLPTALMAPFLYAFIKDVTSKAYPAFIITMAIMLGTPLFKFATSFYGHSLAAAFYFPSFLIWFYAKRNGSVSPPLVFLSAFLLGFMIIMEYPTVILVSILLLYILFTLYKLEQLTNWRIYVIMAVGGILPICLQLYYNYSVFGSPFTTGYSHEATEIFREAHASNFMGIGLPDPRIFFYQTFHPSVGIFWLSPILFVALLGYFFMAKRQEYRAEMIFSLSAVIVYILFFSGYYAWWGGYTFAPRHLIPILPLFVLPLMFVPEKFSILVWSTALVSMGQNLIMAASGFDGLPEYYESMLVGRHIVISKVMLVYEICLSNVLNNNLMNNRGLQLLKLQGFSSLLPLIMLELGLTALFIKLRSWKVTTSTESATI